MLWSDDELRENYVCFPPIFCASDEELKPAFPKICLSDEEGRTNASGGELEPLQCSLRTRFATMHESGTLRSEGQETKRRKQEEHINKHNKKGTTYTCEDYQQI